MALSPGARLGPYEVISPLGAGGMGEVFKARDTRLDRSVAIKILPADFAQNAQLRLRFEREAKTISQLSHPNICTLYDVGDGYLVMELLDGETLANRIAKGPLPLEQVVRIGTQIADALERAHKAGIVHRDLKPSNIMLTKSGAKLLDFGLAKESDTSPLSALTNLRTEQKALTEEGALVGTFQYMAPEQLEGSAVDARTDIFALGAVLYEMATGRHAFEGRSKASLIASILTTEPPSIITLTPASPAALDRLIRTCLSKDPDDRFQCAHDVATALRWIAEVPAVEGPRRTKRDRLAWPTAALLAIAVLALGALLWRMRIARDNAPIVRTEISAPAKTAFDFFTAGAPPAISPDGRKVIFGAVEPGKSRILYVRPLDSLVAQPLTGTDGGSFPFWSPDGRFVAFFADNALKKMEISGGAPVILCSIMDGRGGSWSPDGQTIVFAGRYTPLYRVPASGGTPVEVTKLDERTTSHRWPEFLPDSRHFLYLASPNGSEDPQNTVVVGSIDGTMQKRLVAAASDPHYLNGHLIFVRDKILTAQPFDARTFALGEPFPLKEQQIESNAIFSRSMVSISRSGTLVYQSGNSGRESQLTWIDRAGKALTPVGDKAFYGGVSIAPDGNRVAVNYTNAPQANIWLFDLQRGVKTRLTFNSGNDTGVAWSPDGRQLLYTALDGAGFRFVLRQLATGSEETVLSGKVVGIPVVTSWSSDGDRILFTQPTPATRADIWWMSLAERKPRPYLITPFVETNARFSPDGKWVAYQSTETGNPEIYLSPFPPTGAKWQVSSGGGGVPRWRSDGKELFYAIFNANKIMAVPIQLGDTPQIGQPVKLLDVTIAMPGSGMYDVSRDGKRFLVNTRIGEAAAPAPLVIVQHFDRELRDAVQKE